MNTPLTNAIEALLARDNSRLHMPGHKGNFGGPLKNIYPYDITELAGLESLYENKGAIAETETEYTRIYGTKASLLSAGGSTLCIQAMLTLVCPPGSQLIMARNAHTAAVSAMAMLDLHPIWIQPEFDEIGLVRQPAAREIETLLETNTDAKVVYITSPDYYGNIADIPCIAKVCHKHNAKLIVDNAHGAHLGFLQDNLHPAQLGADICCDSLHKTLPVLTGGALLHIQNAEYVFGAKRAMSLFGSTSPSFIILASADLVLPYLEKNAKDELHMLCKKVDELRKIAVANDFSVPKGLRDPARLTLGFAAAGYTRKAFEKQLETYKITAEYLDDAFCMLLMSPQNRDEDFERLRELLKAEKPDLYTAQKLSMPKLPEVVCSIREAVFAPQEQVNLERAEGRTAGRIQTACPPGVPVLMPGEKICKDCVRFFKSSGILTVDVLK